MTNIFYISLRKGIEVGDKIMKKRILKAVIKFGIIAGVLSAGAIFSIAHAGLGQNHNQTLVRD